MKTEAMPLQSMIDSAPDGIAVVDANGRILWANRTMETLFGYERTELEGLRVETLVPQRLRIRHASYRRDFTNNPHLRPMGLGLDLLASRRDGSEFPVEISLSPLRTDGQVLTTAVIRDVSERKKLQEERTILALELETERERDRIAMDLHDGILQDIYAAALTLELAITEEESETADAAGVERAIDQLHAVVRNIRSYIFDLRPRQFAGTLSEALYDLAREFRQNSQIETSTEIGNNGAIPLSTAVALYNIAHESLSNIQKHARASNVRLVLRFGDEQGRLEIEDDGVGFDPRQKVPEEHRGLRNIAARARAIKGDVRVESAPGKGTRIDVEFPLTAA